MYTSQYDKIPAVSEVLTVRVDRKTKTRLDRLAKATARTKSFVAAEAIRSYLDLNEWQIAEIKKAIKEAEAGAFAGDAEVVATLSRWKAGAH